MTTVEWLTGLTTLAAGIVLLISARKVTPDTPHRTVVVWNVVRVLCFAAIAWFVVSLLS